MNTSAVLARQMIGAELLKLRRNRLLVAYSLLLTTGIVALALLWVKVQQQAGGVHSFENMMRLLGFYFGPIVAVLIGAEAGAGDSSSGVLRDLVVTGRSRLALFGVRAPGALLLLLPLLALAFVVALVVALADPGDQPLPSASLAIQFALWLALSGGVTVMISTGVAALLGSRSVAVTVLIAWFAVACPLLASVAQLGFARQALPLVAIEHFKPGAVGLGVVPTASVTAAAVLALWCGITAALGAWHTQTQDA
jgi:ABC-type transport system involved in multi-copper enzyme maturation permease subunit